MKLFTINHRNLILPILILVIFTSAFQGDKDVSANEFKNYLTQAHEKGQFNGNALIFKEGKIVFQGSFGIGSTNPADSLTLNSVFRLGSVSKQFTAMGIMLLKESGKLSYDQDVRDFIPELPYKGITVRHLLNHVSGLPDYTNLMFEYWKPQLQYNDTAKFISGNGDIIKMLIEKQPPINFKPSEKWEYSNTGYVLLASIITKTSGVPFERYLQEQIFKPAKMTNTVVYKYLPGIDNQMPNRVFGFRSGLGGKDIVSNDIHFLNAAQGDGGIYSTVEDLLKWDRILYKYILISKKTQEEAFTPAILSNGDTTDYGFGWFASKSATGKKVVSHSGGWVGFSTYIYRGIEENNCMVILTNNSSPHIRNVVTSLKNILNEQPYQMPKILISETIGKTVLNEGIDAAVQTYKKIKSSNYKEYNFEENQLNSLGYQLLQMNRLNEALEIFRLNKNEFPQSGNVYDSFGDALIYNGDTANALLNFKEAYEMDSTLIWTKDKINVINEALNDKK